MGKPLKVWLSDEERSAVAEAAAQDGMTLSTYGRYKLFAPEVPTPEIDRQWASEMLLLLGDLLIAVEDLDPTETSEFVLEQLSQSLAALNERTAR